VLAFAGELEMDEAFKVLRTYGRNHGRRLSDVARQLVTGGLRPDEVLVPRPGDIREG
jgi:hypothetical protein